jgi:thiamine transport system permease protein
MAFGHEQIALPRRQLDRRIVAGFCALAAIILLAGGALAGLAGKASSNPQGAFASFDGYLWRIARFTLWQATLSTVLSIVPAVFIARAIARHPSFPGRALILQMFAVPLALPAIVAALGVLALYGRAGVIGSIPWLGSLGTGQGIYGLPGILVAHVFFNMPLATRLLVNALATIPANHWRLSAQLAMNARANFRLIEWPAMRGAIPGIAALIFMLCTTSFTIVLLLGGGPRATTLEVAIYQALRFDFDPARAIALTLVQVTLTSLIVLALARLGAIFHTGAEMDAGARRFSRPGKSESLVNFILIGLASLYVSGPMGAIVMAGLRADLGRLAMDHTVWQATATSLVFATFSAIICTMLSLSFVMARWASSTGAASSSIGRSATIFDLGASLVLVVPPIVIGAGWFILAGTASRIGIVAPVLVVSVNAVMAVPFAIRVIRPAYDAAAARHDRLCGQLSIVGLDRLRLVDWPVLSGPIRTGFAFAMALSLGDLGVIALFGSDHVQTLPYLVLARMGSYRTADASGLALLLGVVCFILMFVSANTKSPRAR